MQRLSARHFRSASVPAAESGITRVYSDAAPAPSGLVDECRHLSISTKALMIMSRTLDGFRHAGIEPVEQHGSTMI
jgi:hypothetical protein